MNYTQLSLDQAPDIATPMRFLVSAPLFAIAAALVLLVNGPEILLNRWLPSTLAATHLITLGFITMSMMGAMFQLLPVLAGIAFPRSGLASTTIHALLSTGIILLAIGLSSGQPAWLRMAIIILTIVFILFILGTSISLFRARSNHASVIGMKYSIAALFITLTLGVLLASGHGWQQYPLLRQYTEIHIAWASIGWITVMTIAIAYQVIPMFQVTSNYPGIMQKALIPAVFTGLAFWSISQYFYLTGSLTNNGLSLVTEIIISLILLGHILVSIRLQLQRKKKLIDSSLYFWLTGLSCLAISILLFIHTRVTDYDHSMLIGLLFFVGFVMSIINGMYYKIIPFLIWLHLNRQLAFTSRSLSSIPTMNEIIPQKQAFLQFILHITSILLLIITVTISPLFFYPAIIGLLLSWGLLVIHIIKSLLIYRHHLPEN